MRKTQEIVEQADVAHHLHEARHQHFTAVLARKIGMTLEHQHAHTDPRQKKPKEQARGPASGYDHIPFVSHALHCSTTARGMTFARF